jgi:hypothetical protein
MEAQQVRSRVKAFCLFSSDRRGIVHYEFTPEDQTVNHSFYLAVLRRLQDAVL